MAIDFMVMPLSRYLVGDYVTPVMRMAWDQGIRYTITTQEGTRTLPPVFRLAARPLQHSVTKSRGWSLKT